LAFTNGKIENVNKNYWRIEFPDRFTSLSHMVCIMPADRIDYHKDFIESPEINQKICLGIFKYLL
jgi:hypothetical protein